MRGGDPTSPARRKAEAQMRAARDDPFERLALAKAFFEAVEREPEHRYGRSEIEFMEWEIDRGVLHPESVGVDGRQGGSPWWRAVNEHLLCDALEAQLLVGDPTPPSSIAVEHWQKFLHRPDPVAFYRAHNTSVVSAYLAAADLAAAENVAEQTLMNLVLSRLFYVHALNLRPQLAGGLFRLGLAARLGPVIGSPGSRLVGLAVHCSDLYPDRYPLGEHDDARHQVLLRARTVATNAAEAARPRRALRSRALERVIDDWLLRPRLAGLYAFAAQDLNIQRIAELIRGGYPSYPRGIAHRGTHAGPRPWPRRAVPARRAGAVAASGCAT